MSQNKFINVMISSRNSVVFDGKELSSIRSEIKRRIETTEIFWKKLFKVWINEDEPTQSFDNTIWEKCLAHSRKADIIICLNCKESGWIREKDSIGICHAELLAAINVARSKVWVITLNNIVSDKPASFKEWLKSTYLEEVDDYYFTLFDATFRDCNIITNQCKCSNFEVTNSPTHTLRKFDTPETETLYQDIINGRKTGESKTKKSELYQVSEDFVVRLGAPSIFTMNIEPLFLDANNRKKYEDIVRNGVCILEMYVIVKGADGKPRLSPVDMGADKSGNEASKYLAKLKALDKMENLITSDQLQCLLVETVKYDTEDTNDVSYAYPEYVCSKCGTKMEALPDHAVNMLFNRHQLGLMKSI